MSPSKIRRAAAALAMSVGLANAQSPYKISTDAEIIESARTLAFDTMDYYKGNLTGMTPGILPGPPPGGDYYWWEGGALWGTMIDYWKLTGDSTYNEVVMQAMLAQVGGGKDYQPKEHTASLGNDDQGFWGMSAMLAAENNFPNPPSEQPQWLALAQAVWNTQADPLRHDETCNGGMRWQIPSTNNGYTYKNSIANGCFFNLGARLARYTNNATYAKHAEDTWNWITGVGLMTNTYDIYDGAHIDTNCTDINFAQFSYNNGVFLLGAAYMYNFTNGEQKWKERVDGLLKNTLDVFFPNKIAYEVACEPELTCTTDMYSFKGYVHRWMSVVTQIAPYTAETILPVLRSSTEAAIAQCVGPVRNRQCGFSWSSGKYDGKWGAGQQMNVLGAVSSLLINRANAPVTSTTGGTSQGDVNAGRSGSGLRDFKPITTGDKAGAGILTFLILASVSGMFGWMSLGA